METDMHSSRDIDFSLPFCVTLCFTSIQIPTPIPIPAYQMHPKYLLIRALRICLKSFLYCQWVFKCILCLSG